jgi:hypothetical protein
MHNRSATLPIGSGVAVSVVANVVASVVASVMGVAMAQQPTKPPATTEPAPTTSKQAAVSPAPQPLHAVSLGLVPYPAKKQSTAQQSKDDAECFDWAKQSTGIDPAAPPPQVAQTTESKNTGSRARGAVRGAAGGAVIGEIVDDKGGEGAAAGALVGAARSHRKEEASKEASKQQADAAAKSEQQSRLDVFRKGYTACMDSRGYTIK